MAKRSKSDLIHIAEVIEAQLNILNTFGYSCEHSVVISTEEYMVEDQCDCVDDFYDDEYSWRPECSRCGDLGYTERQIKEEYAESYMNDYYGMFNQTGLSLVTHDRP